MISLRLSGPEAIGLSACIIVAIAVPVAVARHGSAAVPTVKVAPLSAQDRRVLTASRPLIEGLPTALPEVPQAASDASGHRVTPAQATALLARTPALAPLSRAIADPASIAGPVVSAYLAVLDRRTPPDINQLSSSLEALQTVEGDIEPAIRLVAAQSGRPISAAAGLSAVEHDRRAAGVASLVAGWQEIYGAFTLVEQSAAGS